MQQADSQHGGVTSGQGLTFPIKLRCGQVADLCAEPGLEDALARALGRAFATAQAALPAALAVGQGVVLKSPRLINPVQVDARDADQVLQRVRRAIEAAACAQLLQRADPRRPARVGQQPSRRTAKNAPVEYVGENFDPVRFDADTGSYNIPSYQGAGAPTSLPVRQTPPPTLSASEILDRLDRGDKQLLDDMFYSTPYADVLLVMTQFEKRSPKKFLTMLREKMKADAARITSFGRTETQLTFYAKGRLLDSNARLIRLLKDIPSARVLLREQTQKDADFARLVGLVEALSQVYEQLIAYLKTRKDTVSSFFVDVYTRQVADTLPRIAGIFVLTAGTPSGKDLLRNVVKDVGEHVRWTLVVIDKIKEIDGWIDLYQLLFGTSADQTEEVATLVKARGKYLDAIWVNVIPTTAHITAVSKELDAFYADWQGQAGDEKLKKIAKGLDEVKSLLRSTPISDYWGSYTELDRAFNDKRAQIEKEIQEIDKGVEKISGASNRDSEYLTSLSEIERKIPVLAVKLQLLALWVAAISIQHQTAFHDIGSRSDRRAWFGRLDDIRGELAREFDQPNYETLNASYKNWQQRLNAIQDDVKTAARHEFYVTLGITIFATIVTAGAFAEAGLSVAVVLAEAGTFTLINTVGQAVVLDKPIDPGDVIVDFAENALMFGAFKGLNLIAAAGAKAIAPGRMLAQLGIVFTTTTLVATGVPALLTVIQGKSLTEEAKISVVVNLVVNAAMTLIGGLKTRNKIRDLQEVTLAARMQLIQDLESQSNASAEIMKALDEFIKSPNLSPEKFEELKARSADVLPKFEKSLSRLAGSEFSDAALAKLRLTRAMVQDMAKSVAEAARLIAGAQYVPTSKASVLPPPNKIVSGLVQTSETTFEYNPDTAHHGHTPEQVAAPLRGKGYAVEDEGGGVLKVTAAKGERPILLLPAGEPGAPAFQRGLLERAVGFHTEAETAAIKADLERIYRDLPKLLQSEFVEETALSTLELLVEQRAKIPNRWPVASVRGLAEMLKLERGITRPAIQKLFEALPPDELASLFEKYHDIVKNSDVRPGSNLLVSEEMTPKNSAKLIEAYDKIRLARLTLPEKMSPKAIQGLLRWIREGSDYVAKLKDIPVDQRVARLEADSPIRVPGEVPKAPNVNEKILAKHAAPLRLGLNLFDGEPADVAKQIEALGKAKGGKFSDDAERNAFADTISRYRKQIRGLQEGKNLAANAAGDRREIERVIAGLESGTEVFATGNKTRLKIDPALFKLLRDFTVTNAPATAKVQLDFGGRSADGTIVVEEVSTSDLKLPAEMRKLLPESGEPAGGTIDFGAILSREQGKGTAYEASGRKFQQMIKLRAAALFAKEFLAAFTALSGETASIALPEMVVNVSRADPEAIAVAKQLGFKVVVTPRSAK